MIFRSQVAVGDVVPHTAQQYLSRNSADIGSVLISAVEVTLHAFRMHLPVPIPIPMPCFVTLIASNLQAPGRKFEPPMCAASIFTVSGQLAPKNCREKLLAARARHAWTLLPWTLLCAAYYHGTQACSRCLAM